jgi:hypothetical protein
LNASRTFGWLLDDCTEFVVNAESAEIDMVRLLGGCSADHPLED